MSVLNFSVPISGTLKSPTGWMRGDDGYVFYVFRYHFFAKRRTIDMPAKMGERFRMNRDLNSEIDARKYSTLSTLLDLIRFVD